MDPKLYSVLHVASGFLLTALTFRAFAAPDPETRRSMLKWTGILSLLMLVGGFGLVAKLNYEWEWWIFVKIACWFLLTGLTGMAYRMPQRTGLLSWVAAALVITAIVMVYMVNPRGVTLG
ncbi:MAG: hypothetical protein AAF957_22330 [Planctomycetota bacterium]